MTDCSALPTVEDSELFKQDAGTINEVVTSPNSYTTPASDGKQKKTLAGIAADAAAAIQGVGFINKGEFSTLPTIENVNEVAVFEGNFWLPTEQLPYTATGSSPLTAPEAGKWVVAVTAELLGIARSLNCLNSQVIYSTDTATVLDGVLYIYDAGAQAVWGAPSFNGASETIVSVTGSTLVTTGGTYLLVKDSIRPTVSFIFDDGYQSAISDVAPLFKSKGITCGFAISAALTDSSSSTYASISDMLQAQDDGFEIINHGLDPTPLTDTSNGVEFARNQINGNYDKLRQFGFNVQAYVAGNSVLDPSYISIVEERHSSAYTVAGNGLQVKPIQPYNLERPSLFSLGVAGAKALIDEAVSSEGWAAFYDHDPTQVYFPSSMNLADLEEVIDYAISKGCQVVNPSFARNELGNDEYNSNQEAIDESNREQGLALVNKNLLRDPWYKTIQEAYSGWADGGGSGDGTFTPANRKNGAFGNEIQLSIGANGTIVDGEYVYQSNAQRRESDFFPTSGNLTFSCEPYQTSAAFDDNFELTIGVNQRLTSDNSVVASVESGPCKVDTRARKYSVTIDPKDYAAATYFQVYYRITEKVTGVGASVLIANPKLEQGDKASKYTDDAPLDINDWDFYESIISTLPTGVTADTKLLLSPVNKNFYQIINDEFLCRDTGFYRFDVEIAGAVAGPYSDIETHVRAYKNTVDEGVIQSIRNTGSRLYYRWSATKYMKSGDTLYFTLTQSASGGALNTDAGKRSFVRVCKVN